MSDHKGRFNQKRPLEAVGLGDSGTVHYNLNEVQLYEAAIRRGEGVVAANGPIAVTTGVHTGRSALDKFIVRDGETVNASGGTTTRRCRRSISPASSRTFSPMPRATSCSCRTFLAAPTRPTASPSGGDRAGLACPFHPLPAAPSLV